MEIQRGKEGMKDALYNRQYGATAGCTVRLLENSIPQGQGNIRHGIRADAWFGSVKAAMEVGIRGHECVFQVKTNSALYPKAFIEDALADAPGGVHIVLEGKASNGVPLAAIGYRYSRKTTLFFVCTRNAGSTVKGAEYVMKYTDGYGNICTRLVDRPDLIAKFFASSNVIDTHNQLRQFLLALEKKWLTQNAYFCLATTYLGINVVDTYHLANHHKIINVSANDEKKMSVCTFAGILANQLITQAEQLSMEPSAQFKDDTATLPTVSVTEKSPTSRLSSITSADMDGKLIIRQLEDVNQQLHFLVKYELTTDPSGRKRTKARQCKLCHIEGRGRKDTMYYCISCGLKSSFCNDSNRDCFKQHVAKIKRTTRSSSELFTEV
jgi:hypothetical protein